ncbi:phosphatidylinositol 4-phosphate 5-kinase 8 [Eurytemora carolleeae]|uniref:phosphatidylinositol 4-phosphate 5-kinase 8 n=1 Tax=Eurytemora carolleeae TaxID=1294199 RepID=UPI000C77258E|nr:phosphatidylinositol 4-phosphate 5-kinase 8 [Eurytemora carolleeae]|eukprot:XP_023344099.1 phosphatidylinositol 4-phosphate 5-kinase 8-like [Eurytemora affinis]
MKTNPVSKMNIRRWLGFSLATSLLNSCLGDRGFLSDLLNMGMYMGEMKNALPHGNGTIVYLTNDKFGRINYTGEWRFGMITGYGIMHWKNGAK